MPHGSQAAAQRVTPSTWLEDLSSSGRTAAGAFGLSSWWSPSFSCRRRRRSDLWEVYDPTRRAGSDWLDACVIGLVHGCDVDIGPHRTFLTTCRSHTSLAQLDHHRSHSQPQLRLPLMSSSLQPDRCRRHPSSNNGIGTVPRAFLDARQGDSSAIDNLHQASTSVSLAPLVHCLLLPSLRRPIFIR